MRIFPKRKIFLDHAGATPLDKGVLKKINFLNRFIYSNPSSIFSEGVKARNLIEEARKDIAKTIGAHSDEIIFTGSGTESDALAILGTIRSFRLKNKGVTPHIITTQIEHPAVLENVRWLEKNNLAEVTYLAPKENGILDSKEIRKNIKPNTVLVSIMYANNEIGTIQPIEEIAKEIRHFKKNNFSSETDSSYPIFHTDACQAMNYLFTKNIEKLGVDLMTFNGSKIYGPKGIGVLYKKRSIDLEPLYKGGGQEFNLRSGTENTSLIVGLAQALKKTEAIKEKENLRLIKMRDCVIGQILELEKKFPFKIILNGDREKRLANNINISIFGLSSELIVLELGARGVFVSERSDCKSGNNSFSYVLESIYGKQIEEGKKIGSLRITLGRKTKKRDLKILVKSIKSVFKKYGAWADLN